MKSERIKVLIIDENELFFQHISRIIEKHGISVLGFQSTDNELVLYQDFKPDVVIINVSSPRLSGLKRAANLIAHDPGAKIIGLSIFIKDQYVPGLRAIGAKGYVATIIDFSFFLFAIKEVYNGRECFYSEATFRGEGNSM